MTLLTEPLTFFVPGRPETQGSMRAFPGRNGGAFLVQGSSEHARQRLMDWRHAIRQTAAELVDGGAYPLADPLVVWVAFGMQKPAYAPKRKRTWPVRARSGDLDKLLRAVLDALTGVVWVDDSQVVTSLVSKDWAERPGVRVAIQPVKGQTK